MTKQSTESPRNQIFHRLLASYLTAEAVAHTRLITDGKGGGVRNREKDLLLAEGLIEASKVEKAKDAYKLTPAGKEAVLAAVGSDQEMELQGRSNSAIAGKRLIQIHRIEAQPEGALEKTNLPALKEELGTFLVDKFGHYRNFMIDLLPPSRFDPIRVRNNGFGTISEQDRTIEMLKDLGLIQGSKKELAVTEKGLQQLLQKMSEYPLTGNAELEVMARDLPRKARILSRNKSIEKLREDDKLLVDILVKRNLIQDWNGKPMRGEQGYINFGIQSYDHNWHGALKLSKFFESQRAEGITIQPTLALKVSATEASISGLPSLNNNQLGSLLASVQAEQNARSQRAAGEYLKGAKLL